MKRIQNRIGYLCKLMSQILISMISIKIAQKELLAMIRCGLHMMVKIACLVSQTNKVNWCSMHPLPGKYFINGMNKHIKIIKIKVGR
jgi:hypothetical protein